MNFGVNLRRCPCDLSCGCVQVRARPLHPRGLLSLRDLSVIAQVNFVLNRPRPAHPPH